MNFISRLIDKLFLSSLYVVADARDNSITFSQRLFRHIQRHHKESNAQVLVFTVKEHNTTRYAFMVNPKLEEPAPLADIQVNTQHHTIGFESLIPTVNRIFYDYNIPAGVMVKLSVAIRTSTQGDIYYIIQRPKTTLLCQR